LTSGSAFAISVGPRPAPPSARARRRGAAGAHEVLVGDELVAVLLHHEAGELAAADDEHLLVVLLQLLDERDEVAVAADDDEGVDVVVGERHLEGVEGQVDVGAVLVAARREVALHHADRVLREQPAVVAGALPVAVGDLGDDLAAFLDAVEDGADVEGLAEGGLHADLDVVEIDEDRDFQACLLSRCPSGMGQWACRHPAERLRPSGASRRAAGQPEAPGYLTPAVKDQRRIWPG
jgi:hypothetical protein